MKIQSHRPFYVCGPPRFDICIIVTLTFTKYYVYASVYEARGWLHCGSAESRATIADRLASISRWLSMATHESFEGCALSPPLALEGMGDLWRNALSTCLEVAIKQVVRPAVYMRVERCDHPIKRPTVLSVPCGSVGYFFDRSTKENDSRKIGSGLVQRTKQSGSGARTRYSKRSNAACAFIAIAVTIVPPVV
jgi:hypothetical protein